LLIWSSVAILNGVFLFISYILYEVDIFYGLYNSEIFEPLAVIELILAIGMIAFVCFLQPLWILNQLKNRN